MKLKTLLMGSFLLVALLVVVTGAVCIAELNKISGPMSQGNWQAGEMQSMIASTVFFIALVMIAAMLLAMCLSAFIANAVARPIRRLSKAMDEISRGNLRPGIEKTGRIKEISDLEGSIERILTTLKLAVLENKQSKSKRGR